MHLEITTIETMSGTIHVVVATKVNQYYGRFNFRENKPIILAQMESGLGKVYIGKKIHFNLLDDEGRYYRWSATEVVSVGVDEIPKTEEARLVAQYALIRDDQLRKRYRVATA